MKHEKTLSSHQRQSLESQITPRNIQREHSLLMTLEWTAHERLKCANGWRLWWEPFPWMWLILIWECLKSCLWMCQNHSKLLKISQRKSWKNEWNHSPNQKRTMSQWQLEKTHGATITRKTWCQCHLMLPKNLRDNCSCECDDVAHESWSNYSMHPESQKNCLKMNDFPTQEEPKVHFFHKKCTRNPFRQNFRSSLSFNTNAALVWDHQNGQTSMHHWNQKVENMGQTPFNLIWCLKDIFWNDVKFWISKMTCSCCPLSTKWQMKYHSVIQGCTHQWTMEKKLTIHCAASHKHWLCGCAIESMCFCKDSVFLDLTHSIRTFKMWGPLRNLN